MLCTTSSVLNELKVKKTKDIIDASPFLAQGRIGQPECDESCQGLRVQDGDIVSLSDPDLEIIGIADDECLKRGLAKEAKQGNRRSCQNQYSVKNLANRTIATTTVIKSTTTTAKANSKVEAPE